MSMVMSVYNFVKPTRATQLGRQSTAMRPVRKSTWGEMFRSCYFIKTCTLMFYIFTGREADVKIRWGPAEENGV